MEQEEHLSRKSSFGKLQATHIICIERCVFIYSPVSQKVQRLTLIQPTTIQMRNRRFGHELISSPTVVSGKTPKVKELLRNVIVGASPTIRTPSREIRGTLIRSP